MNCKECTERKRADYWFNVARVLLTIIGGGVGAIIGCLIIRSFGN